MKPSLLFIFIFVAFNTYSNTTIAADFTFKVPLDLKRMNKAAIAIRIHCQVVKYPGNYSRNSVIARNSDWIAIPTNGTINRVIDISMDAYPDKNRADARSYTCTLGSRQGHSMHFSSNPNNAYFQESYRRDLKKPFTYKVSGTIR